MGDFASGSSALFVMVCPFLFYMFFVVLMPGYVLLVSASLVGYCGLFFFCNFVCEVVWVSGKLNCVCCFSSSDWLKSVLLFHVFNVKGLYSFDICCLPLPDK